MSKLLLDEYPLLVSPTLATRIGLYEAIIIQQLHYWMENPKIGKIADGVKWIKNSTEQWQKDNFPFLSLNTVRRTFSELRRRNLILVRDDLNINRTDRTLWYSIHYAELQNAFTLSEQMHLPNLPHSLTETTTETTKEDSSSGDKSPALIPEPLEQNSPSIPLTIPPPETTIPISQLSIDGNQTPDTNQNLPTPEKGDNSTPISNETTSPTKDKPTKKTRKAALKLYSNPELFDLILAFSFADSDPAAVASTVGAIRKAVAKWVYDKNKGKELTEDEINRFLTKMKGLESWSKSQRRDDAYRPKFPAPFMVLIGEYFGNPGVTNSPIKEKITCPDCEGKGVFLRQVNGQTKATVCAKCNGSGKVLKD